MKIVFTTFHNEEYNVLAELSLEMNKRVYCEKHDYKLVVKTDCWHGVHLGWEKMWLLLDAFEKYPDCEWGFFSECDTLITNMDIKLEDIIKDETKHFVITTDCNGINAGNFFIRNSPEGKNFINSAINNISNYANEQDFFKDSYYGNGNFKDAMAIYEQRSFNSYAYEIYGGISPLDSFGNNGSWQPGDFLIHFPGLSLEYRVNITREYLEKVINSNN